MTRIASRGRAVSLFSNCGAGDVGFARSGFRFDVMAELEPARVAVCKLNHPEAKVIEGDLRKTWSNVVTTYRKIAGKEPPTLLSACPPCQGMSSARAGRGKANDVDAGMRDSRNLLVHVVVEVAKALRPTFVVCENVAGILVRQVEHPIVGTATTAARYLTEALAEDYESYPLFVDAASYGVPQTRRRVFIVYVRKDSSARRHLADHALLPFPRATHGPGLKQEFVSIADALEAAELPALDARDRESSGAQGQDALHRVPVWDPRIYRMVSNIPGDTGRSAWTNNTCPECGSVGEDGHVRCGGCGETLPKPIVVDDDGEPRLIVGFGSSYRRMYADRPAATVTTASGRVGSDYTIHPTQNRLLSPRECALLQTFPSEFDWGDAMRTFGHTNVRAMIGEAVPPRLTELHGRALGHVLDGTGTRFLERSECDAHRRAVRKLFAPLKPKDEKRRARGSRTVASR